MTRLADELLAEIESEKLRRPDIHPMYNVAMSAILDALDRGCPDGYDAESAAGALLAVGRAFSRGTPRAPDGAGPVAEAMVEAAGAVVRSLATLAWDTGAMLHEIAKTRGVGECAT